MMIPASRRKGVCNSVPLHDSVTEALELREHTLRRSRHSLDQEAAPAANAVEAIGCELVFCQILRDNGEVPSYDIDEAQPMTGITPLMRAAEESHWRLCSLLLSQRADIRRISIGGACAMSLALTAASSCCCCPSCYSTSGETQLEQANDENIHARQPCCKMAATTALLLLRHSIELQRVIRHDVGCSSSVDGYTGVGDASEVTVFGQRTGELLASAARAALQDEAFLPVLRTLIEEAGVLVDMPVEGPDCRLGTALSVALEPRVPHVERELLHRGRVVEALLAMRADPLRIGPYVPWCGSCATITIPGFAAANNTGQQVLALLTASTPFKGAALMSPLHAVPSEDLEEELGCT